MAAGRNDLRYLNVLHRTCTSLSLNTLLCFFTLLWRGCEESSMILISFCSILLWMMTSSGSRVTPRTEPAFLINLLILFKSLVLMLLPQQMAEHKPFQETDNFVG